MFSQRKKKNNQTNKLTNRFYLKIIRFFKNNLYILRQEYLYFFLITLDNIISHTVVSQNKPTAEPLETRQVFFFFLV